MVHIVDFLIQEYRADSEKVVVSNASIKGAVYTAQEYFELVKSLGFVGDIPPFFFEYTNGENTFSVINVYPIDGSSKVCVEILTDYGGEEVEFDTAHEALSYIRQFGAAQLP